MTVPLLVDTAYARMVAYSKCMSECGLLCLPCPKVSLMTHLAGNYLNAGIMAERWGTGHQSIVPYQVRGVTVGVWVCAK